MLNGYANWLLYTKTVANLVESEDDLSDRSTQKQSGDFCQLYSY